MRCVAFVQAQHSVLPLGPLHVQKRTKKLFGTSYGCLALELADASSEFLTKAVSFGVALWLPVHALLLVTLGLLCDVNAGKFR